MQPVDLSRTIRDHRGDLTDYVVHLTKARVEPPASGLEMLIQILNTGFIRPTLALHSRRTGGVVRPSVKGPHPVVSLTEQPLAAIINTIKVVRGRYAGYGIAYFKPTLFQHGGRPVIYGSEDQLGKRINEGEPGWQEGREIYQGGLPTDLQYLWVKYDPLGVNVFNYTVDFSWEREWRVRFPNPRFRLGGLPIALPNPWSKQRGAIIVAKDAEMAQVASCIESQRRRGAEWTDHIDSVVSLEKTEGKLAQGDNRFGRLETWPSTE